jgi:hypothetical protein
MYFEEKKKVVSAYELREKFLKKQVKAPLYHCLVLYGGTLATASFMLNFHLGGSWLVILLFCATVVTIGDYFINKYSTTYTKAMILFSQEHPKEHELLKAFEQSAKIAKKQKEEEEKLDDKLDTIKFLAGRK